MSKFRLFFAISILIICSSLDATAQHFGFNMFNERNHPNLEWLTAETEHFIIHYPAHIAGIEAEAAAIAEETYSALSANLNVTFDFKIRIFLSDEDEIINGFAVPINNSYTNIWVSLNDVARAWSGPEKWLRTVLAHELAHIFHFEAVKSNLPLLGTLATGTSLPVPWTEGIAQYLTEPWHVLRGDALLRTAIYDGRPSYNDGQSIRNGQLMYASGNSQLRYFSSVYGDTTLAQILAHRNSTLFGIKTHNFNDAFQEVTGKSFRSFEDEWRRHVSIYYHTLAGQMERSDSLDYKRIPATGLITTAAAVSPDTTKLASVGLLSAQRPYQQLVVANLEGGGRKVLTEGSFNAGLSWHPESTHIAYSSATRAPNGSILNDIYVINVKNGRRQRLTVGRRATLPVFSADGSYLYYIVNENGTGNIFRRNFVEGTEERITHYSGDYQIGKLDVHPLDTHLAYSVFKADGSREIAVHDLLTNQSTYFTNPEYDDRDPVWSFDGQLLAYTSMRDYVPNVFVINPFEEKVHEERITALFTGGTALQWVKPTHEFENGSILLQTTNSKASTRVVRIDASRRPAEPIVDVNPAYTTWLTHTPEHVIPQAIPADESLIINRGRYNSFRNISHVATLPLPWYENPDNWGMSFVSLFTEPLSKHMFTYVGVLNAPSFTENSLFFANYINNQFKPSISLNLYRNSFAGRIYERDFLTIVTSGGFLLGSLPRDWIDSPFVNSTIYARLRYEYSDADRFWNVSPEEAVLPLPESGWQNDLQLGLRITSQKPYVHNIIHPLDGWGIEPRVTLAGSFAGGDTEYIRSDLRAYTILPALGTSRFYVYGRAIAQWGDSFVQDFIGFSRFDDIQFGDPLPGLELLYSDSERVRGFSEYAFGNRMLFGSLEYRVPFLPSLNTSVLGLIRFGKMTLSPFIDAGVVWTDDLTPGDDKTSRVGSGIELKNTLNILGLNIMHSLGFAQPVDDLFTDRNQEIYYRVRATIPF